MSVGYYTTKHYNGKNSKNYIGVGDPWGRKLHVRPAHKGKQFQTNPSKFGQTQGYFNKMAYQTSPYHDNKAYLKTQPLADRKNGFSSHDARRRDEFTMDIRARQWREKLKTEQDFAKKNILSKTRPSTTPAAYQDPAALEQLTRQRYREKYADQPELFQTQVTYNLYDIGRTSVTEFNNKSAKDTFYDLHSVAKLGIRRPHTVSTSYETYGNFDVYPTVKPKHGSTTVTKSFYDLGHLAVGSNY